MPTSTEQVGSLDSWRPKGDPVAFVSPRRSLITTLHLPSRVTFLCHQPRSGLPVPEPRRIARVCATMLSRAPMAFHKADTLMMNYTRTHADISKTSPHVTTSCSV